MCRCIRPRSPAWLVTLLLASPLAAQRLTVGQEWKYTQQLTDPFDAFGACATGLGDVDGDGIGDVAVGAPGDDDGSSGNGAVWILFLAADGSVRARQKISAISGWLEAPFFVDQFGTGVAGLGDLDGDGVPDLAVAAPYTGTTGIRNGAAWILFLRRDGTVKAWNQVAPLTSLDGAQLGQSVACIGDVDGNGAVDLVLGQPFASHGALYSGAVWILFLRPDGTLLGEREIGQGLSGFVGPLDSNDRFGSASGSPGDLDGDGIPELVVGAVLDDDGGADAGAAWILYLDRAGAVRSWQKISATSGGFGGLLEPGDLFGASPCAVGDLDGDGIGDLAVGAPGDDDGGRDKGAVWILHLRPDGTVRSERKISETAGGFGGLLEEDPFYSSDRFGSGIAFLGDLDGNGWGDLLVGTPGHGTTFQQNTDTGAAWLLRMGADATVLHERQYLGLVRGWGTHPRVHGKFGSSIAFLGDLDRDGVRDIAVGAQDGDMPSATFARATGTAWILFPNPDGTIKSSRYLGDFTDGFRGPLDRLDAFGCALAALGDLDGDGVEDLAVGARGDDDGGTDNGAVWILFLSPDGTIRAQQKISELEGELGVPLNAQARFGAALAFLGDRDGDGVAELAVGSPGDDDGGNGKGALWILSLDRDGTVKLARKISQTAGGFAGSLTIGDGFGSSIARLGDLDGDGLDDLAVGAPGDNQGGGDQGALWVLFLAQDGSVASERKVNEASAGLPLDPGDRFGSAVACLGDLDGDGAPDLAVGAPFDDQGDLDQGAAWLLWMNPDGTVRAHRRIAERLAGFRGQLSRNDRFGFSLAAAELDGDGLPELLVGSYLDGDFGLYAGGVWALSLDPEARSRPSAASGPTRP